MKRRHFLCAAAVLLAQRAACAASSAAQRRVGVLSGGTRSPGALGIIDAMRGKLHEYGWIEGKTVAYELMWADGDGGRFADLARELVRRKVDVIVAPSSDAALAAQSSTATIPIVMVWSVEPIRLGLIKSYAHPGTNVTGLTTEAGSTIIAKYLDLLTQALPDLSQVAVLRNATSAMQRRILLEMPEIASARNLQVLDFPVRTPDEFAPAFARMSAARAGALIVLADPLFYAHRSDLAALARARRLPSMSSVHEFVESGGLLRYIVDHLDLWRRSATYVHKLLLGADPAVLPVEQPARFELVVNLQTARAIGLALPPSILLRASKVIE